MLASATVRWPRSAAMALVAGLCCATALGCARRSRGSAPDGPVSQMQADRYIRRAIRSSSEGVILLPSKKAERVYELPRLNEIAQGLRRPAAICFLRRAIETMRKSDKDERGYTGVPEGQVKIRARLDAGGSVLLTEVLESGFKDEQMPPCISEAIEDQRWPPNKTGTTHSVDVVYWVSLGIQQDVDTDAYKLRVRREQIDAGVKAKKCLEGRAEPGKYRVEGLNLVDREGGTLTNRVEARGLSLEVRSCVASALKALRLERAAEAFVRPVSPVIDYEVAAGGTVSVAGEKWLELIKLEERAQRAARRAELSDKNKPVGAFDEVAPQVDLGPKPPDVDAPSPETPEPAPKPEPAPDPGQGGLKLDLGGRPR